MLPMFLGIVDQTIVATALPKIGQELGGVERLSWIMVAYLIAVTISAPVFGLLGDSFGRRRLLLMALAMVAASSLFCAVATSVEMLVLGRFAQGLGGGGLLTLSHALIGEAVPPRQRGHYQGYVSTVGVSASMFGPVLGGVLAQYAGWQSVFLVNLPIAALAGALVWRLPSSPSKVEDFRFDYLGLVLFALLVSSALVAIEQLQDLTRLSAPLTVTLIGVGIIVLPVLIWRENRASTPILPLALLGTPAIWKSDALAALQGACMVSLITFIPIYLCVVHGVTAAQAGLLMLPMTASIGLGSIITGRLVTWTGRTAVFPSFGLVGVALSLLYFSWRSPEMSTIAASITLGATSVFMGTVMGVVQITVQAAAGPQQLGRAAASVQLSRALGAAFGTALVGTVIFMTLDLADAEASRMFASVLRRDEASLAALPAGVQHSIAFAFQSGFLTMCAFALAALPLAWTLPIRKV